MLVGLDFPLPAHRNAKLEQLCARIPIVHGIYMETTKIMLWLLEFLMLLTAFVDHLVVGNLRVFPLVLPLDHNGLINDKSEAP